MYSESPHALARGHKSRQDTSEPGSLRCFRVAVPHSRVDYAASNHSIEPLVTCSSVNSQMTYSPYVKAQSAHPNLCRYRRAKEKKDPWLVRTPAGGPYEHYSVGALHPSRDPDSDTKESPAVRDYSVGRRVFDSVLQRSRSAEGGKLVAMHP